MTSAEIIPSATDLIDDLLDALKGLVERDRAEAAASGFSDDEMSWLEDARRAIRQAEAFQSGGSTYEIAVTWHIDDVKELRPDLTDEQCREVLQQAKDRHDAGIGITWDVLEIHADDLFPPKS